MKIFAVKTFANCPETANSRKFSPAKDSRYTLRCSTFALGLFSLLDSFYTFMECNLVVIRNIMQELKQIKWKNIQRAETGHF